MKKYLLLPAFVCAAVVTISPALRADDAIPGPSPSQPATPPQEGQHRGNPLEMLAKKLDLTDDQQTKIKPILEDRHEKMKALRDDTTLTPDDKKAKAKALIESSTEQIKAILTPDQLTKFAALQAEMKEHREKHDQAPAAAPSATP